MFLRSHWSVGNGAFLGGTILVAGCIVALTCAAGSAFSSSPGHADQASLAGDGVFGADLVDQVNESMRLVSSSLVSLDVEAAPGQSFSVVVPLREQSLELILAPHSIRAEGYQLLVQVDDGSCVQRQPGPERTMRGTVMGDPGSVVAASLLDEGLLARIILSDSEEFWVEPIASRFAGATPNLHVIYHRDDVIPGGGTCGADALSHVHPPDKLPGGGGERDDCGDGVLCVAEMACDADYEYYQDYGSISAVEDRISTVINTVNIQYERDVEITHALTAIVVRSSSSDPYTYYDAGDLLYQFRNHWESYHDDIDRDLAELFTGREMDGSTIGVAWVSDICTSWAYSVVQSDCCGGLSCASDLSAHEMGHNWGADHCDDNNYTMYPTLHCSNQFHPTQTIPEIVSYRNYREWCMDAGVPDNDNCADAIDACPGVYEGSTGGGNSDGSASCGSSSSTADVWYSYTPETSGTATVDACAENSYDGVLSAHTGCPGTSSNQVACDDDGCGPSGGSSTITFGVTGGQTYLIRVSGYNGAEGPFTLTIDGPDCAQEDQIAPSPNPSTFEVFPTPTSPTSIMMMSTTAYDYGSPLVRYHYECVDGGPGCSDSSWQHSRMYVNQYATPNWEYSYRVHVRDSALPVHNVTDYSGVFSAITPAAVPGVPLLGNPTCESMEIDIESETGGNPAHTVFAIQCYGTDPADTSWQFKYVTAGGTPSSSATWQTDADWGVTTVGGMNELTLYAFRLVAKSIEDELTDPGPGASLSTTQCGGYGNGDFDTDGDIDLDDFAAFQVCFGQTGAGDCAPGNMIGAPTVDLDDFTEFVDDMNGPE